MCRKGKIIKIKGGNEMRDKGFYFAYRQGEAWGISFAIVYIPSERDFQIGFQLFDLDIAVGYVF